jgi:GNAT superfamily N-acetyltransferase
MIIRDAAPDDAEAACDIVRRSITDLCTLDHRGDRATLDAWLANKTPESFAEWATSDRHIALVAEANGRIAAYGLLDRGGTVALLYVAPEARLQGASRALLAEIETRARELGLSALKLSSTATACRFYERCGFVSAGVPEPGFGVSQCYPMVKQLGGAT